MADETLEVEARLIDSLSPAINKMVAQAKTGLAKMSASAASMASGMETAFKKVVNLKNAIIGFAAVKVFQKTVLAAAEFEVKMREVSTLSEEASDNLQRFSKEILELSIKSGQGLDVLTKGLYDSISAGIAAGDAMGFLENATKLATGGATDTATAVDGLTTILNAFSLDAKQATDVSDAFFVAMKFGKTTVGELASSLGPLAPTARAAGISFDEMLGAVSALTKSGFETTKAVTAMQGALVAINSLTPEVAARMESLGLKYKVTGKEGETFIDILNNISKAGGGTLEGVKALIPNVEGVKGVLALATDEGKNFKEIMELMGGRAGATAEAYAKMTDTFDFQLKRIGQTFKVALIETGKQLTPVVKKLADTFEKFTADGGVDKLSNSISTLISAGKALFITYTTTKLLGVANGFKLIGTESEIAAAKVARGAAIMNGIKLVGLMAVIAAAQIGFDKLIASKEALAEKRGDTGWQDDISQMEIQLQKRKDYDAHVAEANKLYKQAQTESFSKQQETMKLYDKERIAATQLNKEFKDLTGWSYENAQNVMRSAEGAERYLNDLKQIKPMEEARAKAAASGGAGGGGPEKSSATLIGPEAPTYEQRVQAYEIGLALKEEAIQKELDLEMQKYEASKRIFDQAMKDAEKREKDADKKKKKAKKEQDKADELHKQGLEAQKQGQIALTDTLIAESGRGLQMFIKNEKRAQRVALAVSIIQGFVAVSRALSNPPGPPYTIPMAIATGVQAAMNSAAIAQQAFKTGGFPVGQNANVRVNEAGQEAILNAGAVNRMGHGTITTMNAGAVNPGNASVTNEISYSPTFKIESDNVENFVSVLEKNKTEFAGFIEDLGKRGYFSGKKRLSFA